MKRHYWAVLLVAAGALIASAVILGMQTPQALQFAGEASPLSPSLSLWYRRPASENEWVSALPVGNGRLGAMVFGGVVNERLQLNEDTLWAGGPYNPVNPDAKDALPEVRRLLLGGQYAAAARLAGEKVMAKPLAQMPYETIGDLRLTFPNVNLVENYTRDLDLTTATAHVSYTSDGVTFTREVFASAPDQVIVVRLTANVPGHISFEARLQTPQRATVEATSDGDLVMRGVNGDGRGATADGKQIKGALRFESRVRVMATGGTRTASGDAVVVRGANAVTLLIAAATSYRNYADVSADPAARVATALQRASGKTIEAMRTAHIRDYRHLFDRVTLDLGSSPASATPTDQRIRNFAAGGDDALASLYFQYARYLLIASSRPVLNPRTCRASGMTACRRRGAASTPSTSIPR
jgi:alpha-L-fucosidase 2